MFCSDEDLRRLITKSGILKDKSTENANKALEAIKCFIKKQNLIEILQLRDVQNKEDIESYLFEKLLKRNFIYFCLFEIFYF